VDTPSSPGLSKKLTIVVQDLGEQACVSSCPAAVTLYTGIMSAMPATVALGVFPAGYTHRYQFTVTFPDSGLNGADNAYQGASTNVEYDWSSTN
jgi:hypothetical protein